MTAETIVAELRAQADDAERAKITKRMTDPAVTVIGVRMATVFGIAEAHQDLSLDQVDRLLDRDEYEARMVAVSVLDLAARRRSLTVDERRAMYELWLRRIDRMGIWDLIDRSAPRVLGLYLVDRPRDVLFELAASEDVWHRRTAVVATFSIIRSGDTGDAAELCERLAADPERFVQTAIGTALREIGRVDPDRLRAYLDAYGSTISAPARRVALSGLR